MESALCSACSVYRPGSVEQGMCARTRTCDQCVHCWRVHVKIIGVPLFHNCRMSATLFTHAHTVIPSYDVVNTVVVLGRCIQGAPFMLAPSITCLPPPYTPVRVRSRACFCRLPAYTSSMHGRARLLRDMIDTRYTRLSMCDGCP
jgi:hypothetical protein